MVVDSGEPIDQVGPGVDATRAAATRRRRGQHRPRDRGQDRVSAAVQREPDDAAVGAGVSMSRASLVETRGADRREPGGDDVLVRGAEAGAAGQARAALRRVPVAERRRRGDPAAPSGRLGAEDLGRLLVRHGGPFGQLTWYAPCAEATSTSAPRCGDPTRRDAPRASRRRLSPMGARVRDGRGASEPSEQVHVGGGSPHGAGFPRHVSDGSVYSCEHGFPSSAWSVAHIPR